MTRPRSLCLLSVFLLVIGFFPAALGQTGAKTGLKESGDSTPIVIHSKTLEVDDGKKIVTFTGDVHATKDDFVMDCRKMFVYYVSLPDKEKKGNLADRIERIVATGQVKVSRKTGGVALAEKAVYYPENERIVLTGDPSVVQGKDSVKGDKITIYLKQNRSIVESSGTDRAQAVIFPKTGKKGTP